MATIAPHATRAGPIPLSATLASPIYVLSPSRQLPQVDLSWNLARKYLRPTTHRAFLLTMLRHFQVLAVNLRFGIVSFGSLLFVREGWLHDLFVAVMIPSTGSLFVTLAFMSLDVFQLVVRNYEFWFTTVVNALNWVTMALVLGDERALMSFLGWFSFQMVIFMDASYRTMKAATLAVILGIPTTLALCSLVAFKSIQRATFFDISLYGHLFVDAVDIMGFTTTTLAVLLTKMLILKRRRVAPTSGGPGYVTMPCALIRIRLRLVPLSTSTSTTLQKSTHHTVPQLATNAHAKALYIQPLKLSPMITTHVNARRTVLPFRYWTSPPSWVCDNASTWRGLLYSTAVVGVIVLATQTLLIFHYQTGVQYSTTDQCVLLPTATTDIVRTAVACVCSTIFCGVLALFFQRDLLRRLLFNFDYVFSIVQLTAFALCLADMSCWEITRTVTYLTWLLWFTWALSVDALTPMVKHDIFRFKKKMVAPVFGTILLLVLAAVYFIFIMSVHGLRDRQIFQLKLTQHHTFTLHARSVLIGRMATISLWCTRQMYALLVHEEDELNLIRGLVEYESPYATFPRKHNKHTPAIDNEVEARS